MGTIGARQAADLTGLLGEVQAIEALVLVQAMELTGEPEAFSAAAHRLQRLVRRFSEPLAEDRPLSDDIQTLAAALRDPARDADLLGASDAGAPVTDEAEPCAMP
ncbi:MAG: hypothetical protein ABEK42_01165 [Thiohalorhabdaceae bacterium]